MQGEQNHEKSGINSDEEQEAGDQRDLSVLRHEDVQDRQILSKQSWQ